MRYFFPGFAILTLLGCNLADDKPSDFRQRQDRMLEDPFGAGTGLDETDISGGGTTDFRKDAFKRDVNSVFSP
jgi:hypothetical protein